VAQKGCFASDDDDGGGDDSSYYNTHRLFLERTLTDRPVLIETRFVFCEVGAEVLSIIWMTFKLEKITYSPTESLRHKLWCNESAIATHFFLQPRFLILSSHFTPLLHSYSK
jgi:hypothetical protein